MDLAIAEPLARMYAASPAAVPTSVELVALKDWIREQWLKIPARIRMTPAAVTLDQAKHRYTNTGELLISTANNEHPYLCHLDNSRFRAVHDWHHIIAGADDTLEGEVLAYYVARSVAPQSIWWMLCSEIVLQAAACIHFGDYQQQKLVRI
jgi:hypothetical protein